MKLLEVEPGPESRGNRTLAEVATTYVQAHGREKLNELLRDHYASPEGPLPSFYRSLTALPPSLRIFVTTNYDPYLSRALSSRDPVIVVRERGLERIVESRPTIYHIHGVAIEPGSCVITEGDYAAWASENSLLSQVSTGELARRTIIMIGYQYRDPHLRRLLVDVARGVRNAGGEPNPIYFVLPDPDRHAFGVFSELGVPTVLVPANGTQFIQWAAKEMDVKLRAESTELLEQHINPTVLKDARARAKSLIHESGDENPASALGDLAIETAEGLRSSGRLLYAHQEYKSAARYFREAGRDDDAVSALTDAIEIAWDRLHNAERAEPHLKVELPNSLLSAASPLVRGRFLAAAGRAFAGAGRTEQAVDFADKLEEIVDENLSSELRAGLSSARAMIAISTADFRKAHEAFASLSEASGSFEEREQSAVQSLFFQGLTDDPTVAINNLQELEVDYSVEDYRLRATGWLRSLILDSAGATDAFRSAARAALQCGSITGAATALRAATWAELRGTSPSISTETDSAKAWHLELAEVDARPEATTVERLLQRSAYNLAFGKLREAVMPAYQAMNLALFVLDPVGLSKAYELLASVFIRVGGISRNQEDIKNAAVFLAAAGAGGNGRSEPLQTFKILFTNNASASCLRGVVEGLTAGDVDPVGRVGALRVLGSVADLIPADLAAEVLEFAVAGLKKEWYFGAQVNEPKPACELLTKIADGLSQTQLSTAREAIFRCLEGSHAVARRELLQGLTTTFILSDSPIQNGGALADYLLRALAASQPSDFYYEDILVAIANLAPLVDEEALKDGLLKAITSSEMDEPLTLFWRLQTGESVPRDEVTAALEALGAAIERHILEAEEGKSWGGGIAYSQHYLKSLVDNAEPEYRDTLLPRALKLIGDRRHLVACRASYLPLAAYLAARDEMHRKEAILQFLSIAEHGLEAAHSFDVQGHHPFSMITIDSGSVEEIREYALSIVAMLHIDADSATRKIISQKVLYFSVDPEPTIRAAAIRHLGSIAAESESGCDSVETMKGRIVKALHDPATVVRASAISAVPNILDSLPSPMKAAALQVIKAYAENDNAPASIVKSARETYDKLLLGSETVSG